MTTRSLEVHVTDHCNLTCADCCSLSPFLAPWFMPADQLARDLAVAKTVLRPTWFKLVGGEPLLHPGLLELLDVARASGVAEIVSVTTNGVLLPRMDEGFWRRVDHVTLSVYPRPKIALEQIRETASRFGVPLNVKVQDQFEELTLAAPRADDAETARIFEVCWLRDRCHMIRDGRFYLCTRPPHFAAFDARKGLRLAGDDEGVALSPRPSLAEELAAYLNRDIPIASCERCLGGTGARHPHRLLGRQELR